MAEQDFGRQFGRDGEGSAGWEGSYGDQPDGRSLGELLKRLSNDTGELVTQEISLARAELKESVTNVGKGAAKLGFAAAFGVAGMIALTAALVIGLGHLIGEHYGWSALIVGLAETIIAGVSAKSAMSSMKPASMKPKETIETLREDKSWAKQEARDLKREITSNPTTAQSGRQGRRDGME
jgi:uncharacterized membrane protein YqjE